MDKNIEQKKQESKKEEPEIKNQNAQERKEQKKTITLTQEEYNKLKQEAEQSKEYKEKILRLQADFDNFRKRLEREKQEFMRYANETLVVELLNIVDDLERTVELAQEKHEDFSAFLKGIEMILAHLYELLKKYGLATIEAKGNIFDPNYHEALLKIETNEYPEDTIVEELQKGYMLNERVIRTAKVKVSKKPSFDNTEDGSASASEAKPEGG
jgi:molecular chaperone GrpE